MRLTRACNRAHSGLHFSFFVVLLPRKEVISLAEIKTLREKSPQAIEEAVRAGEYAKALEIAQATGNCRFLKKDWEIIHRLAAAAAFYLGGGLSGTDTAMLELALTEAENAVRLGAESEQVLEGNYYFSLSLYMHILYGLSRKEEAFRLIAKAISLNESNCDLPAAQAAMLVQEQKFQEAISPAEAAIDLAKKTGNLKVQGAAHWYLGLAYEGLLDKDNALKHMQIARNIYQNTQLGGTASVLSCIAEAEAAIKDLT